MIRDAILRLLEADDLMALFLELPDDRDWVSNVSPGLMRHGVDGSFSDAMVMTRDQGWRTLVPYLFRITGIPGQIEMINTGELAQAKNHTDIIQAADIIHENADWRARKLF